jgi:hypothetical protein
MATTAQKGPYTHDFSDCTAKSQKSPADYAYMPLVDVQDMIDSVTIVLSAPSWRSMSIAGSCNEASRSSRAGTVGSGGWSRSVATMGASAGKPTKGTANPVSAEQGAAAFAGERGI